MGANDVANLALTCPHCNARKWRETGGPDPDTGQAVPFFHPRRDVWADHFAFSARTPGERVGLTPTGRATVVGLRINDPDMLTLRLLLAELNFFPEVIA